MRRTLIPIALLFALVSLMLAPQLADAQSQPDDGASERKSKKKEVGEPIYVWWEGESPEETNFPARSDFSVNTLEEDAVELLSDGNWLSNSGRRTGQAAFARYKVSVPESGVYRLWTRKFWKHGPFKWRFDQGDWSEIGRDVGLEDSTPLKRFVGANWVFMGERDLKRKSYTLEIELLAGVGESLTACFDCFCLIKGDFEPRGKYKPGQRSGLAGEGYWPFEPGIDTFDGSGFDLRDLNEERAGIDGYVERKGKEIVLGNGEPVRFWGVNCGGGVLELSQPSQQYLARRLSKLGVNLVRIHTPYFIQELDDLTTLDTVKVERLHYFVNLLAEQGIYTSLSFYFPLWLSMRDAHGFKGYRDQDNKHPFALLFFDEDFQEIFRTWLEKLLEPVSAFSGMSLGKDPAVAMIELVNEDSYFFWTFNANSIPEVQLAKLEEAFGDYLKDKYRSIDKASAAWGWDKQTRDNPRDGRMQLLDAWHMTRDGANQSPAKKKRMSDQLAFLHHSQTTFYEDTIEWLRKKQKIKSMVSCGNWHTADPALMQPIEFSTYLPGDIIDSHGYFGGPHNGEAASYSVAPGQSYASRSAMVQPHRSPVFVVGVEDYPRMVSEIGWPNPNRFRAEWPFLQATYGALHGVDAFLSFAISTAHWDTAPAKFALNDPILLGQFPALALAYRMGYITEAKPVVQETLVLDELFDYQPSQAVAAQNLDALRGGDGDSKSSGGIDPRAFMVGPVVQGFGKKSELKVEKLDKYIDDRKGVVESATKELTWLSEHNTVVVNAPSIQGACGFLARAGEIKCDQLELECESDYASICVVALDGEEIKNSARMLVQMATESQHFGWEESGEGVIESVGGYPFGVLELDAKIKLTLAGKDDYRVVVLDGVGNELHELDPELWTARGARLEITLPKDALYLLIERVGRD